MKLAREYSAWIWLSVLLVVVAALSVLSSTSAAPATPLSLDSPAPDGALALKMWLTRIGYTIHRQDTYAEPAGDRTLLILEPERDASHSEVARLMSWTRAGGRLVVAGDENISLAGAFGLHFNFAPASSVRVTQPALLQPGTTHLSGSTSVVTSPGEDRGSIASTKHGNVLIREPVGRGELWVLSAPTLLQNSSIGRAENRRLALNLAGPPSSITVDQPSLEAGSSTYWLAGTAWGIAVLFTLGILVLFRWLGGWRLGPPTVPFSERRRPAVEYVLSLAGLLRRARRRSDVLAIYQRELRDRLRRRFGTDAPGELPRDIAETVSGLLQPQSDLSEEALIQRVEAIVRCEEALKERV